jgi:hypothetical protein
VLSEKNQADKLLLTANTTVLVAFFFVFQSPINNNSTKFALIISFTLFIVSLIMILWFLHRQPIRLSLFNELKTKTVKKYSKRISAFIENIAVPLARLKTRDEILGKLSSVKSKEEHAELMSSIENEIENLKNGKSSMPKTKEEDEATGYVIEGFLDQLTTASKADFHKAFRSPLIENQAKLKNTADKLSFRFRRHIFVSASVFSIFSIFVELLSK